MTRDLTSIKILLASPSDLDDEINQLKIIVNELNRTFISNYGITLVLINWQTHAIPDVASDVQEAVNRHLPDDYDIFIALFWSRVGTKTPRAQSGTIEEFEKAYKKYQENSDLVHIMVYFKIQPLQIDPSLIDTDQIIQLQLFKKSLKEKGVFYDEFNTIDEFSQLLRTHLNDCVFRFHKQQTGSSENKLTERRDDIPQSVIQDEPGFLDLIESVTRNTARSSEKLEHFKNAIEELNKKTEESTKKLNSVIGNDQQKIPQYERIVNNQAENMEDFVENMTPELKTFDNALLTSLDSLNQIILILPSFGKTPDNEKQLRDVMQSYDKLKKSLISSKIPIINLRDAVQNMPKMTTKLNRAKRNYVVLLNSFLLSTERGLNVLEKIENTYIDIFEDWKNIPI